MSDNHDLRAKLNLRDGKDTLSISTVEDQLYGKSG